VNISSWPAWSWGFSISRIARRFLEVQDNLDCARGLDDDLHVYLSPGSYTLTPGRSQQKAFSRSFMSLGSVIAAVVLHCNHCRLSCWFNDQDLLLPPGNGGHSPPLLRWPRVSRAEQFHLRRAAWAQGLPVLRVPGRLVYARLPSVQDRRHLDRQAETQQYLPPRRARHCGLTEQQLVQAPGERRAAPSHTGPGRREPSRKSAPAWAGPGRAVGYRRPAAQAPRRGCSRGSGIGGLIERVRVRVGDGPGRDD
jgi:hypothetical protein